MSRQRRRTSRRARCCSGGDPSSVAAQHHLGPALRYGCRQTRAVPSGSWDGCSPPFFQATDTLSHIERAFARRSRGSRSDKARRTNTRLSRGYFTDGSPGPTGAVAGSRSPVRSLRTRACDGARLPQPNRGPMTDDRSRESPTRSRPVSTQDQTIAA